MGEHSRQDNVIRELRNALGRFTTGVAIVTAPGLDGDPVGMTINSFATVSLEPALVSWCIDRRAASYRDFVNAGHFSITVLAQDQAELAMRFATRGADKFRGIEIGGDAVPVLAGACARFECRRFRSITLGDHCMLIGEILEFAQSPAAPLVFSGGGFAQLQADIGSTARAA